MKTKRLFFLLLTLSLFFRLSGADSIKELIELQKSNKYDILIEKALQLLNNSSLKLDTNQRAELYFLIAESYSALNNQQLATLYYNRVISASPQSDFAPQAKLKIALLATDSNTRINLLQEILNQYKNLPIIIPATSELVKYHYRFNNFQVIYDLIKKNDILERKDEFFPELTIYFVIACYNLKRYYEGIQNLIRLEQKQPEILIKDPVYLQVAGKLYLENLNFKKAAHYLIRLINVYPESKEAVSSLTELTRALERDKKYFSAAFFLISALRKIEDFGLLIELVKILDRLPAEEIERLKSLSIVLTDRQAILKKVIEQAPLYEQRREATILLASGKDISADPIKTIEFYLQALIKKRDFELERIFQTRVDNFIDFSKDNPLEIILLWSKLKTRKSLLTAELLKKLALNFYQFGLFSEAEEIIQHLLNYKIYREQWEFARELYLKIDLHLMRSKKFSPEQLEKIKSSSELLFYYLFLLNKQNDHNQYEKLLLEFTPSIEIDYYSAKVLYYKALLLKTKDNYDSALNLVNTILPLNFWNNTEKSDLLTLKADLLFLQANLDEALNIYSDLIKQNLVNSSEWLYHQIISILFEKGEKEKALSWLNEFRQKFPQSYFLDKLKIYVR